jgi:hypothetical protein
VLHSGGQARNPHLERLREIVLTEATLDIFLDLTVREARSSVAGADEAGHLPRQRRASHDGSLDERAGWKDRSAPVRDEVGPLPPGDP